MVRFPVSKGGLLGQSWVFLLLTLAGPQPSVAPGRRTHRVVAEELTVATITEFPISLVRGGRSAGASLGAAILFLAQSLVCLTRLRQLAGQATVCKFVPLAPWVPASGEKGPEVRQGDALCQSCHSQL